MQKYISRQAKISKYRTDCELLYADKDSTYIKYWVACISYWDPVLHH